MDLKTMLLYFLFIVALSHESQAVEREALFLRRRNFDEFVGKGYILESMTRSRIQCSNVCLRDVQCRSFTYEEDRRACYLHHSHWPLPGDSRPGAATFYRTRCPRSWDPLDDNTCVKLISEKMSWQNALQNCLQLGGNLTSVEAQDKKSPLRNYLKAHKVTHVWLGASELKKKGEWKWEATGNTADIRWGLDQPNGGLGENCLVMWGPDLEMHDDFCTSALSSVCEIPL